MHGIGLRAKLLAGSAGIIIFLGVIMVFLAETVLHQKLIDKLRKRAVTIARRIASESVNHVVTKNFFELEMLLKDFKSGEDDIIYIFVMNPGGEVLSHTFADGFPVDLRDMNTVPGGQEYAIRHLRGETGDILDIAVPLIGGRAGVARMGLSEATVDKDVNEVTFLVIKLVFVILVAGGVMTAVFASNITKPLLKLAKAAEALGRGEMGTRIEITTNDEIGQLGRTFNEMIDRRKETDEKLRASEKQFRDITSSLGEGVMVMDMNGRLSFMNPEAERILGWTVAELHGLNIHNIIHRQRDDGSELSEKDCPHFRVIRTGEKYVADNEVFRHKNGTIFPVTYISAPVFEQGRVVASVIAFRDITDRRHLEQERERLIAELRAAIEKISTLKGLIPICASCKKIRDDKGYWNQIEDYISRHSEAEFSHGICPDCARKLYPEYYKDYDDNRTS